VPIDESVTEDHVVCLICGHKYHMIGKHLTVEYGITPAQYRTLFDLPSNYPMAAPSYSKKRSVIAHRIQLGSHVLRRKGGRPRKLHVV
jgi:predicted transcriptional regulator